MSTHASLPKSARAFTQEIFTEIWITSTVEIAFARVWRPFRQGSQIEANDKVAWSEKTKQNRQLVLGLPEPKAATILPTIGYDHIVDP